MNKRRIDSAMGFDRPVALATTWILVVVSSAWGQLGSGFDDLQARLGCADWRRHWHRAGGGDSGERICRCSVQLSGWIHYAHERFPSRRERPCTVGA